MITKEEFDKRYKALQDEYVEQAEIRKKAMNRCDEIIKECHKPEDEFFGNK
jgi:hypothetical protein